MIKLLHREFEISIMTDFFKKHYPLSLFIILFALLAVHLFVHIPFLITEYFGEVDASKLANDSIKAIYGGFHDLEYTIHSSPLYNHVLTFLLKAGVISISDIPFWMAFASVISSAIVTAALFIFVLRLTTSLIAALGASLILQLIPVFWYNSIYGFTTMVSLAFFMVSVVLFQIALDERSTRQKYLLLFGAFFIYVLAVTTKLDILLASAIYGLPVWRSARSLKSKVIWISCLALLSGVVFLLSNQYAEFLNTSQEVAYDHDLTEFRHKWPVYPGIFLSYENLLTIAKAVGIFSIPTAIIVLFLVGWRREWRFTIIWLMLSALPLVLFWGIRQSNSARHNLATALFLCIVLSLPFTMRNWKKWAWAVFLCAIFLTNYFYFPPHTNHHSPSGRLLASTSLLKDLLKYPHSIGRKIELLPYERVAFIKNGKIQSYFRFESLRSNQLSYVSHTRPSRGVTTLVMQNGNLKQSYLWLYDAEMSEVHSLVRRKYFLVICDKHLANKLSHLKELEGKWVSLDQLEPTLPTYKMIR